MFNLTNQEREAAYDKYAVFRELQMEEELLRAWKTPSEEEKAENNENNENEENDDDDDEEEDEEKSDNDEEVSLFTNH